MVGSDGEDHFDGGSGFDWATYKNDHARRHRRHASSATSIEPPVAPSTPASWTASPIVEGLSGSALRRRPARRRRRRGTRSPTPARSGSVLTNIGLIDGLQALLGAGVTSFSAGNIILGGDGSDIIEGRGGDDIIDGDRWLNVRISVRAEHRRHGRRDRSVDSMKELVPDMLAGTINPGQL